MTEEKRRAVSGASEKGRQFEDEVELALASLCAEYPLRIKYARQPALVLQSEEEVRPDFDLSVDLPHLKTMHLIECQNRGRNSKDLLHKIQYIRNKSNRNKFIFVYATTVTDETRRALINQGVIVFSFAEFLVFLQRIRLTVAQTPPPCDGGDGGGAAWGGECDPIDHLP